MLTTISACLHVGAADQRSPLDTHTHTHVSGLHHIHTLHTCGHGEVMFYIALYNVANHIDDNLSPVNLD